MVGIPKLYQQSKIVKLYTASMVGGTVPPIVPALPKSKENGLRLEIGPIGKYNINIGQIQIKFILSL